MKTTPTTREPNETHEHFLVRLGIPTIRERVAAAYQSLTLIVAATAADHADAGEIKDLTVAMHEAARAAREHLYWLTLSEDSVLDALAPDDDQKRDLDRVNDHVS